MQIRCGGGMLQMLVQRGRVIVVGADGGVCASCGVQEQCNLLATHQTRYVVVPKTGQGAGCCVLLRE